MKRTSTLALLLASGVPMASSAVMADSAVFVNVDLIHDLTDTGQYLIGLTSANDMIAMQLAEDGATLTAIGEAFDNVDGGFVFALAKLVQGDDGLRLDRVQSGGVLMLDEKTALKLDPRLVALKLMEADGGEYLGMMTVKNEGHEMVFGNEAQIGEGTLVELTKFVLAQKTLIIAENKTTGIILAMEAIKSGATWISSRAIGRLDDGMMKDVSVSDLAILGICIPTVPTSVDGDHARRVAA